MALWGSSTPPEEGIGAKKSRWMAVAGYETPEKPNTWCLKPEK
ncbi:MAG: hypothetical protein AVDCRST_MAG22-2258 [uncultured Rubrobacteraceae bacterium]|uniref:Uncharacterized protein n=1 Tax=uncultured Rubrobacteraceae bacterium TaxID=349277 RepID=A0A6J4PJV1_9ACTN|nr:MAG: hypothetical protein AVDCRST_MAG22-2258 [uncultured Rubrobacteraceae bacterium]